MDGAPQVSVWWRQAGIVGVGVTMLVAGACVHDLAIYPAGSATLGLLMLAGWLTASLGWWGVRQWDAAVQAREGGIDFLLRRAHVRSGFIALWWGAAVCVLGWGEFTLLGRSYGNVWAGFAAGAEVALCVLFPAMLFTVGVTHRRVRLLKQDRPRPSPLPPWEQPHVDGLIADHWRGRYHLPRAFWLHGLGLNLAIAVLSAAALLIAERIDVWLSAIISLALLVAYPPVLVWQGVGIWRSARRYREYYGHSIAPIAARVCVLIVAVGVARSYAVSGWTRAKELDSILRGDPGWEPFSARVVPGTHAVLIRGNLQTGCHRRFREVLASAPEVRTVLIDSSGGRLAEGERIAILVRERGLDTRSVGECDSAATVVFLAGRRRSVARGGRVGFHAPSSPEASLLLMLAMRFQLELDMRAAGVSPLFVRRTLQTPPASMWYPTEGEMRAAGVLTP